MCSPTRATLLTGYYPAQHGVKYTLEEDMPADEFPRVEMPTSFKNVVAVMAAAGYKVVYKGKWHCSEPAGSRWEPSDLARYGFHRWSPPNAGANQDVDQIGEGHVDHDGRYMNARGPVEAGREGVLQYLELVAAHQQPFFIIVSLVNPHDVLMYPRKYRAAGYDDSWLRGDIELPATVDEDLSTKRTAQKEWLRLVNIGTGRLGTHERKRNYINFYGNLMKLADGYLVEVLDALERQRLLESTLVIRTPITAMGLAHDGQRQKCFNFYEETLRIPLIYSNPRLWRGPQSSRLMVSHVDFLPTLASLVKAPASARADWVGVDYSDHILRRLALPTQDEIVFTYDDWQAGEASRVYVTPPQHIVSLRERCWKIAQYYYDAFGKVPSQWEMYDLKTDPLERQNLAHQGYNRTGAGEAIHTPAAQARAREGKAPAAAPGHPTTAGGRQRDEDRAGIRNGLAVGKRPARRAVSR